MLFSSAALNPAKRSRSRATTAAGALSGKRRIAKLGGGWCDFAGQLGNLPDRDPGNVRRPDPP